MGREVLRMAGYEDFLDGRIDALTFQDKLTDAGVQCPIGTAMWGAGNTEALP
jgi:hypothetical protein